MPFILDECKFVVRQTCLSLAVYTEIQGQLAVAEASDTSISAMLGLDSIETTSTKTFYLNRVNVPPFWQKLGIGTNLMLRMCKLFDASNINCLCEPVPYDYALSLKRYDGSKAETISEIKLIEFYKSFGFVKDETRGLFVRSAKPLVTNYVTPTSKESA